MDRQSALFLRMAEILDASELGFDESQRQKCVADWIEIKMSVEAVVAAMRGEEE